MYLGLLRTKEWTATDILIAIGIILLWAAELLMALMGSPWTTLVPLLALQVASLPILRALAKRRWERIDWLICKPIRAATQSLRAAQ
jgi:membrane protein implicated in regulation of membrane protease activity